jgi:hypothetical protein
VDLALRKEAAHTAEVDMFARKVSVRLKPDSLRLFASLVERKILPWLRKQEGFLDLIILALPDSSEVATISFWDQEANAQADNSSDYPEVVEILEELLDGIPYVKTFQGSRWSVRRFKRSPACPNQNPKIGQEPRRHRAPTNRVQPVFDGKLGSGWST